MSARRERGFTLIELMIGLAIFAFLILIAGPMYADFMGNSQVRNGAENALMGVRLAQAEALRGNLQAKFVLDPTAGTGGWTVYRYNDGDGILGDANCPNSGAPQWCLVQSYSVADGAGRTNGLTPTPAGANTVLFNGLGQIVPNSTALVAPTGSDTITEIDVTNTNVSISSRRPLHVVIQPGAGTSGIKLCDPAVTDTSDPRICPS